jgi:rhamnogalacturonyl hydrolase YesR
LNLDNTYEMNINLKNLTVISFLLIPSCFSGLTRAQELPSGKTIEALAAISIDYEQEHKSLSNKWPYSEYFRGLYEYYKVSSDTANLNNVIRWGRANSWDLPKGKGAGNNSDIACAQAYIDLYLLDRYREERIKNVRTWGEKSLQDKSYRIDNPGNLSMVLPVFAGLGTIYNNENYYQKINEIFLNLRDSQKMYDPEKHLWKSEDKNGSDRFSLEMNGRVLSGLSKTLELIQSGRFRKDYETMLKEMAESLAPLQRSDGYWNEDAGDTLETKGGDLLSTTLIVNGLAGGINKGVLNRKDYQPLVTRSWESILRALVKPDGTVVFPLLNDDRLALLTGSLLIAGSEMYTLQKSVEPKQKIKKVKEEDEKKKAEVSSNKNEGKSGKESRNDKKKK